MGTFAAFQLVDTTTGLPIANRSIPVVRFTDDIPLGSISTGIKGGRGRWEIPGEDAVSLLLPGGGRQDLVSIEKQLATGGSSIQYVSGEVTPDVGTPVHEYFTIGPATIDGVEYEAEQAVVLFLVQGAWVHKVVDLPKPPSVTLLDVHASELASGTSSTSFSFAGTGTVPRDGLLVVGGSSHANAMTVSVGGLSVPQIVPVAGWDNPTPSLHAVPVEAGHELDVTVTVPFARTWLAVSLVLVTGTESVAYTTTAPKNTTTGGSFIPAAPEGSVILSHHVTRNGPTPAWSAGMTALDARSFSGNYPVGDPRAGSTIHVGTAWGFHPGGGTYRVSPNATELIASAAFARPLA